MLIKASITFSLNMVDFDQLLLEVVDRWLGASSANNNVHMMLIKNNIKTYEEFHVMDKEYVAALERPIARAPTKLKEVHAIRVNKLLSFI